MDVLIKTVEFFFIVALFTLYSFAQDGASVRQMVIRFEIIDQRRWLIPADALHKNVVAVIVLAIDTSVPVLLQTKRGAFLIKDERNKRSEPNELGGKNG